jgi:hypothetical protein
MRARRAYLDDSEVEGAIAICGAVIIPHGEFGWAERTHSLAVGQLFSANEIDEKFQEFHAWELFKGEGSFKGFSQEERFEAIRILLMALDPFQLPFIYSAVDEKKLSKNPLSKSLFGTAHPLVACFKMCALGIEKWAQGRHLQNPPTVLVDYQDEYLFVADDTKDSHLKKKMRAAYRLLRAAHPYTMGVENRLHHAHDDLYFGDSRESVGIQLADLCTYFMQRHLSKRDANAKDEGEEFYEMFASRAICARPEPEWSQYRELLLSHDDAGFGQAKGA